MTAATSRRTPLRPTGLTVLYDASCPVCRRARRWVERQRRLVSVRFVAAGSEQAATRFPHLDVGSTVADVTVVTDEGAVLRGEQAWIAVLWSVARTRHLAFDLAHGRRTGILRRVKGATDTVRRLSAATADPVRPPTWPPPSHRDTCSSCRA